MHTNFLDHAIKLAKQSIDSGGGPFGAVIVKDKRIIAEGSNSVTCDYDPTAHAEMTAIRRAARTLQSFRLDGCSLYTSSEPCPMCLAAIYWAHIDRVVYANSHQQAAAAGFDDSFIYQQINQPHSAKSICIEQIKEPGCLSKANEIFQIWQQKKDKIRY